jgi:hypothetical protein
MIMPQHPMAHLLAPARDGNLDLLALRLAIDVAGIQSALQALQKGADSIQTTLAEMSISHTSITVANKSIRRSIESIAVLLEDIHHVTRS